MTAGQLMSDAPCVTVCYSQEVLVRSTRPPKTPEMQVYINSSAKFAIGLTPLRSGNAEKQVIYHNFTTGRTHISASTHDSQGWKSG